MSAIIQYLKKEKDTLLTVIKDLVEFETPSNDKEANDKQIRYVADLCTAMGMGVELVEQSQTGNHLKAVWGNNNANGQILLLCHLDTVWPIGTLRDRPFRIDGDKVYGPGVYDMKTGAAQAIFAIRAMHKLGITTDKRIVILFNTDEEIGSPTSRAVIEGEARQSDVVLVMEPSVPPMGALKTFRKGVGAFDIRITGKASHAGSAPEEGISAISELAYQIQHLHSLAAPEKGTTVNVGIVRGGTKRNVVAPRASAKIDVRVISLEEAKRITKDMLTVKQFVPGTKIEISGGLNRPPMIRTEKTIELFKKAQSLAHELGLTLEEASSGGGSDGNFTAALGIPTLDGLGAVGDGAHAVHEHVLVPHIVPRTALLVKLLETL